MSDITVIIPAFNPGPYLMEAVESVFAQTVQDWSIVVVDDGSTEPFPVPPRLGGRIRVIHKANGGPGSARNVGLDESSGPLVAFLDADDVWMPTKLERQIAVLEADPALRLCTTQFRFIDGDGVQGGLGYGRAMSRSDLLATGDGICTSAVLMRRGPERFRARFTMAEDFDMWIRLSGNRPEGYLPTVEVLCRRTHGTNLTSRYQDSWRGVKDVYRAHPEPAAVAGMAAYRRVFANQAWDAARAAGLRGAPRHIAAAARISPRTTMGLISEALGNRARPSWGPKEPMRAANGDGSSPNPDPGDPPPPGPAQQASPRHGE